MTKTTTTKKLYGRDLAEYEHMDVDELLNQLSTEELEKLSKEVDPDVSKTIHGDFWVFLIYTDLPCRSRPAVILGRQLTKGRSSPN